MKDKGVLFLYRLFHDLDRHHHLLEKMQGQMEAFIHSGYVVDSIFLGQEGMYFNGSLRLKRTLRTPYQKYKYFLRQFFRDVETIIGHKKYRCYYIRHFAATRSLISFLKKKKDQQIVGTIFLEVPTYPYEAEYKGVLQKTALYVDRYYRKKLHPWVDYIIHFGSEKNIWNIPCIGTENGVMLQPTSTFLKKEQRNKIVFIAIGNIAFWWGLNDLITALANDIELVQKRNIMLKIVGEGKEKKILKSLIKRLNLGEIIEFIPYTRRKKLPRLLEGADIGIGTLAMHKKALTQTSSLKHRLYATHGIPILYRGVDNDFENQEWTYRLEKDENISISKIIDWYDRLLLMPTILQEMQEYASLHLSWTTKMQPILKKLLEKQ